jgi:hypothetical protein
MQAERKTWVNRIMTAGWVLLVLIVLGLFLKERIAQFPAWLRKLKREPVAIVSGIKSKNMAGFRCDFSRPEDAEIWVTAGARFEVVPSPFGSPERWARVIYYPVESAGFLWTDDTMPTMDWREARAFSFTVFNPQGFDVDLKIKVKDASGQSFQRAEKIAPGQSRRIEVPIGQIAERIDASRINYLNLFLWEPSSETMLYYRDFAFPASARDASSTALVRFMGLEFPASASPGETVEGSFYFIARQSLGADHSLLLRLSRDGRVIPLAEVSPPFPTSQWPPGRLTKVGPVAVTIPPGLVPGTYDLEVLLAQPLEVAGRIQNYFQPYENPELKDFRVSKIQVTGGGK